MAPRQWLQRILGVPTCSGVRRQWVPGTSEFDPPPGGIHVGARGLTSRRGHSGRRPTPNVGVSAPQWSPRSMADPRGALCRYARANAVRRRGELGNCLALQHPLTSWALFPAWSRSAGGPEVAARFETA